MKSASLFHYTKIEFAKEIIENSNLKLSYHPKINDPFDLDKDIIYDPEDRDGSKLYKTLCDSKDLHTLGPGFALIGKVSKENTLKIINKCISNWDLKSTVLKIPFICFSDKNDISSMWAHYGDNFKGVSLEFSDSFCAAEKMKYEYCNLQSSVISAERLVKLFLDNKVERINYGKDLLLNKHTDWKYEREFRLIGKPYPSTKYTILNGERFFPFNLNELKTIYFGLNTPDNEINNIVKLLKSKNITHVNLEKMRRDPGYMHIRFEQINEKIEAYG